ncbi:FAD-dependent oxidoreductase [Antrihabitans spumae]|uniref:FAD-dependent oxidoreductase n=1 Tax=Antrihabitans spumae TaxID=3373370 RepID=A0ABW7JZ07_9NOCA
MLKRVVIVGNGMAGARLAEELRYRDPCAAALRIIVIGAEQHPGYNRIMLSHILTGTMTVDDATLRPADWWRANDIDVRIGVKAVDLDVAARSVRCSDGSLVEYDELVLATGAVPCLPRIRGVYRADGSAARGVVVYRTLDDCKRIAAQLEPGLRVVVVGAGLLGLEVACALRSRSVDVAVVDVCDSPLARQTDAVGGAVLARTLEQIGLRLELGRIAASFADSELTLDDGTRLGADLVLLSAGVRPDVELAARAGIGTDRGITVDDCLRTDTAKVWAIGDCAEHRGIVNGLVRPAWEQADVVADLISERDIGSRYLGTDNVVRVKAHGIDLASMGLIDAETNSRSHEVVSIADSARGTYAKLVIADDRLVGALLINTPHAAGTVAQLYDRQTVVPSDRLALLVGRGAVPADADLPRMPDDALVCRCNSISKGAVTAAIMRGEDTVAALARSTRATTGCGGCVDLVGALCAAARLPQRPGSSSMRVPC